MPINSQHPLYRVHIDQWKRCRDAYNGEDAVKEAGTNYLPHISPDQEPAGYEAYKKRASYYEAVARTVDGFVGAISRKPHQIELPGSIQGIFEDATNEGVSLDDLIKELSVETLLMYRGAVVVDYDEENSRPYLAFYPAESILNWGKDFVALTETIYEPSDEDRYDLKPVEQVRYLSVEDGKYTVSLWRKSSSSVAPTDEWIKFEEFVPSKRGKPFDTLPFFWISGSGRSSDVSKPPLLGLVNTSLSHYRTSADLEHGRHFTALPTLYVTGVSSDEPIQVGAAAVIQLSDPNAKAGYAEFTGQGLKSLEVALETKEHQMATLGASIIAGGKKGVEAAETARIRTSGENSLLIGVVSTIEEALTAALKFAAEWQGDAGEVSVKINRDFIDSHLDPQMIVGMVQAYQNGAIDLDTFLYNLFKAEMLPPESDYEQLAEKIRKETKADEAQALSAKPDPAAPGKALGEKLNDTESSS